jgi:hypothetical protein
MAVKHHAALKQSEIAGTKLANARQAVERNETSRQKLATQTDHNSRQQATLEPRKTIRQLDVALDSVLTATKLTLALLITFAIRQYLSSMPMSPHTFISRVFGVQGRRETRPDEIRVIFYENPRDPQVNAVLSQACLALNSRALTRRGKRLHYEVSSPP